MRINTNVSALNAYGNLGRVQSQVSESMAKLSSGFRINKAADDAAGLGISNKLRSDIRSMTQASRNAEQANSVLQIAEGGAGTIQKMLERMKELATQANSDSVDSDARTRINAEFSALKSEITRTVDTTKFQGRQLLSGSTASVDTNVANSTALAAGTGLFEATVSGTAAGTYSFTQGADGELTIDNGAGVTQTLTGLTAGRQSVTFDTFGITLELDANFDETAAAGTLDGLDVVVTAGSGDSSYMISSSGEAVQDKVTLTAVNLSLGAGGLNIATNDVTTAANAATAIAALDAAIGTVSSKLGQIGAAQNRIGYALENVKTSIQNYSAAESVIRDVDMAEEMTKFSKNNILAQAGTAMLAQANQAGQGVLQLLRG